MERSITIDGNQLTAREGESVLDCALRHGINIPHLCNHPSLTPYGACRMCLVEIEGMRGCPPSCATPVTDGMVVQTNTDKLRDLRQSILELMMLEHPSACLVCSKRDRCEQFRPHSEKEGRTTGCHTCNDKTQCEIRVLTEDLDLNLLPIPPTYHHRPLERSSPFIDRDLNLCILCGRCVRICKLHQQHGVIDFVNRASDVYIGQAFGRSLREAGCMFCGSCVDVCPNGTMADRFAKWYGKPDKTTAITCAFCDQGCAVIAEAAEGKLITAQGADHSQPLCVLGRFALAEFFNSTHRLRVPQIRVGTALREVAMDTAIASAAETLAGYKGAAFALVCTTASSLEDRHVFQKFAHETMQSPHYIERTPDARGVAKAALPDGVKAVLSTGDCVDRVQRRNLEWLMVMDLLPSPALDTAQVVFPSAGFAEVDGTILDSLGAARPLHAACQAPGQARPDWKTVAALAAAMGSADFDWNSVGDIAKEANLHAPQFRMKRETAPAPARDTRLCRTFYRGHLLAEQVSGLREILPPEPCAEEEKAVAPAEQKAFCILRKQEVAPNIYEIVIHAPHVAKRAKAGQFCIVMADDASERVPYTLCGWNVDDGTITLVVQEKGRSSRKLVLMQEGDSLAHMVGPLGVPFEIKNYGRVVLLAGCYGIGAMAPMARALHAAGNHVTVAVEARSHYLAYYNDALAGLCDVFVQTTIDGSFGFKGHAVDYLDAQLKQGEHVDLVTAIGCPFMMMLAAESTQPYNIPTQVALNPIMLDGTGMCGACRVSVGDEVKFACVDGPFFDAHRVNWDELRNRRDAYSYEEIQSVGVSAPVTLIEQARERHHCLR